MRTQLGEVIPIVDRDIYSGHRSGANLECKETCPTGKKGSYWLDIWAHDYNYSTAQFAEIERTEGSGAFPLRFNIDLTVSRQDLIVSQFALTGPYDVVGSDSGAVNVQFFVRKKQPQGYEIYNAQVGPHVPLP